MTKTVQFIRQRLKTETDPLERVSLERMLRNWREVEDQPLKIFMQNCDQYYLITDYLSEMTYD